tara:strand:- start:37 stop:204 length:168 start_codon:yes stop_codon:yes gene_type:complete
MEKEKTDTPTPEIEPSCVIEMVLSFDIYSKLLNHSKRNDKSVEQTVRNLIEEGCK